MPTGALGRLKQKVSAALSRGSGGPGSRSAPPAPRPGPTSSGAPAGADGIDVSYAPEHDGDADPGEVVWTWVPFEDDPSQGKDRPVLVIGWDGPQLAAVQLSSKDHASRRDAGEWVAVGTGAWDAQGRPSYVDASRLLRVSPAAVRREGAALDRSRFEVVLARVRELHGWSG
ncbi:type II toxin-antitoxin system PemK/MazF family toxin [Aquihabitans sp. G128]|uniref:type II toxin-antitoxin system PemK/MazF family toxin n=1 Tax=Aquihabitans sp. G128 TaxID=2849779 RepID=UPI001C244160|nr:type II toxin-antitoxin system PemK/MazF family toxin [Aquihabitans sp. G128]QXC60046.1 type II toxin-antitoxin system PemK/MazF family toxin [Aquihabitans sp. G128]